MQSSARLKLWRHMMSPALIVSLAALAACGSGHNEGREARQPSGPSSVATGRATRQPTDNAGDTPSDTAVTAPVRAVELFSAADLARVGDALARGTTTARTMVRHADVWPIQARRSDSGVPEVHEDWIDVTWVQAGRAVLLTGGRLSGSHQESAGELRDGSIQDGTSRPIAAGDVFIIPAGTPHQFVLSPGDTIRYLTVKVRDRQHGGR